MSVELSNHPGQASKLLKISCWSWKKQRSKAKIIPNPDIDTYMKILGLETCSETIIGDAVKRDIRWSKEKVNNRCPQRKGADFLQEVISKKDQAQYWYIQDKSYNYITTDKFVKAFQDSTIGKKLEEELSKPYDKRKSNENAFVFSSHSITKWEMLRTCMDRELFTFEAELICLPLQNYPVESFLWTAITYYGIGYSHETERQVSMPFLGTLWTASGINIFFRLLASVTRKPHTAALSGSLSLLGSFMFSGFILPQYPGASKATISNKKFKALRQLDKPNIDEQLESNSAEEPNTYTSFTKAAFRPGILTALMGISGAGKTTLMDVLCGRKTRGTIEGEIRIGGYPKVQETFTEYQVIVNRMTYIHHISQLKSQLCIQPGCDSHNGLVHKQKRDKQLLTVLPMIARERLVFYRERSAGMYPSYVYALAQVIIEMPYIFILAVTYTIITFPTIVSGLT
ncbi:hypothetical protein HPP92_027789 [Vanilla planifolia]|uniref:ABC-2 type transporter transmembrane domain-containing protein n=1 Tax=Vanilla planifolia TaxID=51239 RepID=A0A835P7N9_VANPL|nr:hypothetical protein HPP92_027789 [Vanilla planifolia]